MLVNSRSLHCVARAEHDVLLKKPSCSRPALEDPKAYFVTRTTKLSCSLTCSVGLLTESDFALMIKCSTRVEIERFVPDARRANCDESNAMKAIQFARDAPCKSVIVCISNSSRHTPCSIAVLHAMQMKSVSQQGIWDCFITGRLYVRTP